MATEKTEFVFPDEQEEKKTTQQETSDEIEVEVVDDTPEQDRNRKPLDKPVNEPTQEELEGYSASVRARINELTHARHDERRKREATEREREEALRAAEAIIEENKSLKKRLEEDSTTNASQTKQLAEIQLATAKAKLRAAHEAGDSEAMADAQEEVATAVLALQQAKSFKPTPLQKESASDTVSTDIPKRPPATPKQDPKAASWKAENSWFGVDKRMTAFALGVHQELVEKGYDTSSDEYYDTLNQELRGTFPKAFKAPEKSSEKPPATVVAPASRSVSANKITLSKTQVQIAKRLGVPLDQYARQVALLKEQERNG